MAPDDNLISQVKKCARWVASLQNTAGFGRGENEKRVELNVLQDIASFRRRLVQNSVGTSPNFLDLGLATGSMLLGFLLGTFVFRRFFKPKAEERSEIDLDYEHIAFMV